MLTYTITLSGDELVLVGEGVGALPFKQVAPLMAKIQTQINEQDAARAKEQPE